MPRTGIEPVTRGFQWQPIKFCVNKNPSNIKRILDCGAVMFSDLPRVNSSFLSVECYARLA